MIYDIYDIYIYIYTYTVYTCYVYIYTLYMYEFCVIYMIYIYDILYICNMLLSSGECFRELFGAVEYMQTNSWKFRSQLELRIELPNHMVV